MKKVRNFLIIFIPFCVLTVVCIISLYSNHIPENPPGTVGNTGGNLNNGGLFCEDEDIVYFSNAYDNGSLYSMHADETDIKKLSSSNVRSINAGGNYLYYYQDYSAASESFASIFRVTGIYRSKKTGKDNTCLKLIPSPSLSLCGNTLFYQAESAGNGTVLFRIETNKKNDMQISDHLINPASIYNGMIYFGGTQNDHRLYTLNPNGNSILPIFDGNVYNPVVQDDYVYYMDISSDYRLCRYSLSNQSVEVLTNDRLDTFNVAGDMIYYQKSSAEDPALKRMRLDGSQNEVVAAGIYENINATSEYVYFNAYDAPTPVFHTPLYGPVSVSTFTAAAQAALDENK